MSHDPADTLSAVLPSLPPASDDGLTVLDPRFPIRCAEPPILFWQLVREWEDRETVVSLTARASQADAITQERFVRRTAEETMPAMRAITAPVPYKELEPATLTEEWDTVYGARNPVGA